MDVVECRSEKQWDEVLAQFTDPPFLQSWAWGEFQKKLENETFRILVKEGRRVEAAAQLYIVRSRFFTFLYCPRGPLARNKEGLKEILTFLRTKARENGADFLFIEPNNVSFFNELVYLLEGFVNNYTIQPQHTLVISLNRSADILFRSFRKSTRYLIKQAMKKNVTISVFNTLSRWNDFARLLLETEKRQKFLLQSSTYLRRQFTKLAEQKIAKLFIAYCGDIPVAGAIILQYRGTATYLYAASSENGRKIGAAHFLVWSAIQNAKQKGCKAFDFWGIAPKDKPKHPWSGISVFKKGFGGEVITFPDAYAFPVHASRYKLYRLVTFLRAKRILRIAQRKWLSVVKRE
ncbi:peptidoglycan bridge formation glycyltransferase FemA/FemB family protein [Candidatus Curtissbacteria bacterium]|nr:peptidoglycan bridge formation glycyltransferase FemA/FemB family protein [Candidatus Curtissbacteria bacterium]